MKRQRLKDYFSSVWNLSLNCTKGRKWEKHPNVIVQNPPLLPLDGANGDRAPVPNMSWPPEGQEKHLDYPNFSLSVSEDEDFSPGGADSKRRQLEKT